jgi:hypothetical protein
VRKAASSALIRLAVPFAGVLLGDTRGARHAVLAAQRFFDSLRPDDEAPDFCSEASIASALGRCLRDIGEPEQAITMSAAALRGYEPWRVRNRCWIQADLTSAHLLRHDLEHAAALGRDALRYPDLLLPDIIGCCLASTAPEGDGPNEPHLGGPAG